MLTLNIQMIIKHVDIQEKCWLASLDKHDKNNFEMYTFQIAM